ncbi:MAG TPA: serine hydrolase domain-containing protein, partial [Gemmatimonadaceae bacterium]|nr:serine hydrolase domain-containing protein [Gemmatimonadaceae bacterium]
VSGKSLRDFADERIFKPLGMTNTHFHDDYTMVVPGRTSAYVMRDGSWHVSIPNYDTYGATSLFTTVGDLLKWEANLDNPTVGDRTLIARMETPTPLTSGDTSNYGFGLVADRYRGARAINHSGGDAGYRTFVERFPDLGLATAVLCNSGSANPGLLARRVADAYVGSALAPVQGDVAPQGAPQGVAISPEKLRARAGVYLDPRTMQVNALTFRDGKLMVGVQGNQPLVPISEDRMAVPGERTIAVFNDAASTLDLVPPAGRPRRMERHAPVTTTPQLMASYAGEYVSDELGGAIKRIVAADSTLTLQTRTSSSITLRLVFADTFLGGGYTIQFARANGQVIGFDVTNSRMRHVKFVKRKSP